MAMQRAHWKNRMGFVVAAAGSAVGLGNIWRFPYITGENGGGWFVLIYLICIAVVGLPIMMAEIFIGRTAQNSPVGAFRALSRPTSAWLGVGWLGVAAAFVILSFYSVIAGWSMHYAWLSVTNAFHDMAPEAIGAHFESVGTDNGLQIFWHVLFMLLTIAIVIGGIQQGLERWARILMPAFFVMLLALLVRAMSTDAFPDAFRFVFGFHSEQLTAGSVLEALGQAFFTLSLGMGAMITYGSYLKSDDDLVSTSVIVCVLDTSVAIMACLVIFPIVFMFGMDAGGGPGLAFQSLPIAFSQMAGGTIWATIFFVLLTFAALTSSISLLEVAVSYFIDEKGWARSRATLVCGGLITVLGVPSALSGGTWLFGSGMESGIGTSWLGLFDTVSGSYLLPLGGLGIALFVAWRVAGDVREQGFKTGSRFGALYWGWVQLLRYLVPLGVIAVFLHAVGVI